MVATKKITKIKQHNTIFTTFPIPNLNTHIEMNLTILSQNTAYHPLRKLQLSSIVTNCQENRKIIPDKLFHFSF
ncbi:MAG: hypothetical protein RI980_667 [Bacteroidota bacterium]|jgi:hypothetical protein